MPPITHPAEDEDEEEDDPPAAPAPILAVAPADGVRPERTEAPWGVRLPKYPKVKVRWMATWAAVRHQYERGEDYTAIVAWLEKVHPHLAFSADVVADIIRAGEAGLLDRPPGISHKVT